MALYKCRISWWSDRVYTTNWRTIVKCIVASVSRLSSLNLYLLQFHLLLSVFYTGKISWRPPNRTVVSQLAVLGNTIKKTRKKILNLKLLTLLIRHQSLGVCATVTIFCYLVLDLFFFYSRKVVSFATLHTVRNITSSKYSKVVQLNDEQISKK